MYALDMTAAVRRAETVEVPDEVPGAARERTSQRLTDELAVLAGHLNVVHAQVASVMAEALRADAWQGGGITGPDHWLRWCTGMSSSHARALVAIASRVEELPVTFAAFANGEITVDQAALIFRRVPAHNDAEIAAFATQATVEQLRRVVYAYPFEHPARPDTDTEHAPAPTDDHGAFEPGSGDASATPHPTGPTAAAGDPTGHGHAGPDAPDTPAMSDAGDHAAAPGAGGSGPAGAAAGGGRPGPKPPHRLLDEAVKTAIAAGRVTHGFNENGRFSLHVDLPADEGAIVAQALAEARDRLFDLHGTGVTWADALVDVAARSLDTITNPERRDRYRTYVMVDEHGPWIIGGPPIPQPLFEKLTCDTTIHPVDRRDGIPLNVGRSRRTPSNHARRIIRHRDKTCRYPGCTRTFGLEIHHLVHWTRNGPTDTANLLHLCTGPNSHHDAVHRGLISIEGNADLADGLVFRDRHGSKVIARQPAVPPNGTPPPGPPDGHRYQRPPGEPLHLELVSFTSPPPTRPAA